MRRAESKGALDGLRTLGYTEVVPCAQGATGHHERAEAMELVNEQCRNQAEQALYREDPEQALRWINLAHARTFGHKKSARYEAWGDRVAKDAGIVRHNEYADDGDAVLVCFKCKATHSHLEPHGQCRDCHEAVKAARKAE